MPRFTAPLSLLLVLHERCVASSRSHNAALCQCGARPLKTAWIVDRRYGGTLEVRGQSLSRGTSVVFFQPSGSSALLTQPLSRGWKKIGTMTFDAAVVSFNGDHVFHVNHPAWREDRNDPRTTVASKVEALRTHPSSPLPRERTD